MTRGTHRAALAICICAIAVGLAAVAAPQKTPGQITDVYEDLLQRYLGAFHRALPDVPADELAYRLYFMFGTGVTTMINDGTLRAVGGELSDVTQEPDEVLDRLVRFVCAGMSAPFDLPPEEPQQNGSVRAEVSGNSVF